MKISESEMEIMHLIWESGQPVSAAWLAERLPQKQWKQTTLLTFLTRLAEKGAVTVSKEGRANLYRPAITPEEYRMQETERFLRHIHGGSLNSLFAALTAAEQLDKAEAEELRRLLDGR